VYPTGSVKPSSFKSADPVRRSGSIEQCLAHEDGRSAGGVDSKTEYEVQRQHMMREWADVVGALLISLVIPPGLSVSFKPKKPASPRR
jgi:hypothetical protein